MSAEASESVAATLGVPDPPPPTQDPPKLPPKSPLRLRNVASLSAVALTISDAPSISTSAPTPSPGHRPPPLVFPSVSSTPESISNLLSTAAGASSRNTSTTRSLDSRPASLHVSRRPSTASSMLSLESSLGGLMPDTPTSLDTISRLALALPSQSDLDNASSNTGTTFDSQMNQQQSSEADGLGLGLEVPASSSSLLSVDRSLPITPSSPSTPSYVPPSTSNPAAAAQTSKRVHALNELLTSERVYASDLAVMRNVYIPLALGQKPLMNMPSADPQASSSASNALLDALGDGEEAPMTPQDVRVVFSNTEELAVFADAFAERIEASMGDALGGEGAAAEGGGDGGEDTTKTDSIGALLLEVAPLMKQLYTVYITRHPLALSRFAILTAPLPSSRSNSLGTSSSTPSSSSKKPDGKLSSSVVGAPSGYTTANNAKAVDMPAPMRKYLANARVLTERHTNAWDLPSLLIKPVQRLLKYPLLLQTLISSTTETLPSHPDLPNLIKAKEVFETIARDVNEARRRWEIVKAVLDGYGFGGKLPQASSVNGVGGAKSGPARPTPSKAGSADSGSGSTLSGFARVVNVMGGSTGGSSSALLRSSTSSKRPASAGQGASASPFGRRTSASAASGGSGGGEDEIAQNPLSRITALKVKLKTSLVPSNFPSTAAAKEAQQTSDELQAWETRLKSCETVLRETFNQLVVDWSRSVRDMYGALGSWAVRLGRVLEDPVIILPDGSVGGDDAISMFVDVVRGLLTVWTDLDQTLQSTLHPLLTSLLGSLSRPLTLVQHCIALHPLHIQHLNTPYSKTRSPVLLSSSKTFLALLAQLRLEMPKYLELFDRGFGGVVMRISRMQARFWEECFTRWTLYAMTIGVDTGGGAGLIAGESGETVPSDMLVPPTPASGSGFVSTRRASAASASSASLQRQSKYTTSSGGDAAGSSTTTVDKDNSITATVALFRERWESTEKTIAELTLLQPRISRSARISAGSTQEQTSSSSKKGKGKAKEDVRASTSSSQLADYVYLTASGFSSQRSSTNEPLMRSHSTRDRRDSGDANRERSNTASSFQTFASPSTMSSSPSTPSKDYSAGLYWGAPTISVPDKKERKRKEKADRAEAIRLVEERAKAEKAAAPKAPRKDSGSGAGFSSFAMGGFIPGGVVPSSSPKEERNLDGIPQRSHSLGGESAKSASKDSTKRRGSKASDKHSRPAPTPPVPIPPPNSGPSNIADRTRDVLFGLLPSSVVEDDQRATPSLPSLSQMSPLGLSMERSPPLSPVMPGEFPRSSIPQPRPSLQQSRTSHPFVSAGERRESLEHSSSPPRGPPARVSEEGIWDSLYDTSQQSYKFSSQATPKTPSPIAKAKFDYQQRAALGGLEEHPSPPRTRTSSASERHRKEGKHSRSRSVPPEPTSPTEASPPSRHHHHHHHHDRERERHHRPETPPIMYETLYVVTCVHPFHPPRGARHQSLPFLDLEINDVVDILLEDGHPSQHPDLPIYVDDGDDCMLVGRDERENIGWCLASFVMPLV